MKIALTGASGRIGNVVVRRLLQDGHTIRVLLRRESRALAGLPVEVIEGDLFDKHAVSELVKDCEVVFHLAALVSILGGQHGKVHRVNVDGTRNVLEASHRHGVRRLVYFGSVHAFQEAAKHEVFDETRPLALHSRTAYDRSKAEALDTALRFSTEKNIEVVALCPTSVIGPFDFEPSLSGKMFIDFYHQKIPLLVPGGFDWVDVRDVAEAAARAIDQGRNGEAYLLAGRYATVAELAELVRQTTGKPVPKRTAPDWLLRLGVPFVETFARWTGRRPLYTGEALDALRGGSRQMSFEKARRELGYSARPLEETIAAAYAWFMENDYL